MTESHWPYQPPRAELDTRAEPGFRPVPPVWFWYVAYCIAMAVLYLFVAGMGGLMLAMPETPNMQPGDQIGVIVYGVVLLLVGLPLAALYGAAPFLPKTRVAWIVGFATIGLGATSACCIPACIPLFYFWIKPETKTFFGVQ